MMNGRDDFSSQVKDVLAKRVGYRCSNPACRKPTSGPQTNPAKAINLGVAAHLTAASPGGPRYDTTLSPEARSAESNGLWLCQNCAKLIDSDVTRYPLEVLRAWKTVAEHQALIELEKRGSNDESPIVRFQRLETLMPELLAEMRADLTKYPLSREFVLLKKSWVYLGVGHELRYFYEDHNQLDNKVQIMQNVEAIKDIAFNKVKRFIFTEAFVDYLSMFNQAVQTNSQSGIAD
ncbi:MAG: hypothetical protein WC443_09500 [Desulfobaccales bacterium]